VLRLPRKVPDRAVARLWKVGFNNRKTVVIAIHWWREVPNPGRKVRSLEGTDERALPDLAVSTDKQFESIHWDLEGSPSIASETAVSNQD
jgi:hypothetical protein